MNSLIDFERSVRKIRFQQLGPSKVMEFTSGVISSLLEKVMILNLPQQSYDFQFTDKVMIFNLPWQL